MTDVTPDQLTVRADGSRSCGCVWQHLDDGRVRFTRRCEPHAGMCRSLEDWEIELVRESAFPSAFTVASRAGQPVVRARLNRERPLR